MSDPATGAVPLQYGLDARRRRWHWLALMMFLLALLAGPIVAMTVYVMDSYSMLDHDLICPSCGGWGATVLVAGSVVLFAACGSVFVWMVFRGTVLAMLFSGASILLAGLDAGLAVAFHMMIRT